MLAYSTTARLLNEEGTDSLTHSTSSHGGFGGPEELLMMILNPMVRATGAHGTVQTASEEIGGGEAILMKHVRLKKTERSGFSLEPG
jgi:hypothetical protein